MDDINYLKLGEDVYALKKISRQGVDISEELKEYYENKDKARREQLHNSVAESMVDEWNTQCNHLEKYNKRGTVEVPRELMNKLITYHGNVFYELKVMIYAPHEVTISKSYMEEAGVDLQSHPMLEQFGRTDSIIIKIEPTIFLPLVVGYDARGDKIRMFDTHTFHTYGDGRLCTDHHSASEFWQLSRTELEHQLSRVNWFSPAAHRVRYQGNTVCRLSDILNVNTIREARAHNREEDAQWRTTPSATPSAL